MRVLGTPRLRLQITTTAGAPRDATIHAWLTVGPPNTTTTRSQFFSSFFFYFLLAFCLLLLLPLVLLGIAWLQESLDQLLFGGRWALPMVHGGPFWGVLTAPFSHSDWSHLVSNSLWFLPLSYLVLLNGVRAYVAVWIGVYATAAMVWLWLPVASHGLSGVVYGLLAYLLLIGWLEKRPLSVILSLGCLLAYGGLLPALLPFLNPPGVSWIGHLSGFVGGLIAAVAVQRRPSPPELLR